MKVWKRSVFVVLWLVAGGGWGAEGMKSVWSGVYTDEQATAGETIYFNRCATCHGDDLGGVEKAPALVGASFRESWHGKTLRKLLERIESMPPDEPQAVSTDEAAKVLAFLLRSSEMPSGSSALPIDRAQLADITFERTKP
ncbi:MAG: cytochrome c [Acidobacteriota bacterium]